ncbi:MAG TPA: universal stress protein [Acidimicrobiia bacterium]|jgi:nucleotide-binding universal stress UspA family protein
MNRLLLAVDGSDHSRRAAMLAGEMSASMDSLVDIVYVMPDRTAVPDGALREYARVEHVHLPDGAILEAAGRSVVAQAARLVKEAGGKVADATIAFGKPAPVIVALADELGADCIIMGRRGLGDIQGLVMGSVSHRVGQLSARTLVTTA